jgi:uncharacterized protein YceK
MEVLIMNAKRLVPIIAGLLLVSGCATTSPTAEDNPGQSRYDQQYIGAVNKLARETGTYVIWVNPPRAKSKDDAGE